MGMKPRYQDDDSLISDQLAIGNCRGWTAISQLRRDGRARIDQLMAQGDQEAVKERTSERRCSRSGGAGCYEAKPR
jgi:hypothetical protein